MIAVTTLQVILIISPTDFGETFRTKLDLACVLGFLCVDYHLYLGLLTDLNDIKMFFELFDNVSAYFFADVHYFSDGGWVHGC